MLYSISTELFYLTDARFRFSHYTLSVVFVMHLTVFIFLSCIMYFDVQLIQICQISTNITECNCMQFDNRGNCFHGNQFSWVQERMVSTLEQMQVPNGTGPGVRRSKRPLLASRTSCNVLWKPPKFGNKVKIDNKVQFGNKFANWWNVWSVDGVIVYGHVPECHVPFWRGRVHNFLWDPHIDHKTSWGTISNVPWYIPVRRA